MGRTHDRAVERKKNDAGDQHGAQFALQLNAVADLMKEIKPIAQNRLDHAKFS